MSMKSVANGDEQYSPASIAGKTREMPKVAEGD